MISKKRRAEERVFAFCQCSLQIGGTDWRLGTYEDQADAARTFDSVARILGQPLNFPDDDAGLTAGPKSAKAGQAVADAVQAAKKFIMRPKIGRSKGKTGYDYYCMAIKSKLQAKHPRLGWNELVRDHISPQWRRRVATQGGSGS